MKRGTTKKEERQNSVDEFQNNPHYQAIALFGNKNDDDVHFLNEQLYRWIVFPWERVNGGM